MSSINYKETHTIVITVVQWYNILKGKHYSCVPVHGLYIIYYNLYNLFRSLRVHSRLLGHSCISIVSFCVVFCRSLFVFLFFFFWPLYCLSYFNLLLLINPLYPNTNLFTMFCFSCVKCTCSLCLHSEHVYHYRQL